MFTIAEFRGITKTRNVSKDLEVANAQFIVADENGLDDVIMVTIFNEDILELQDLKKSQEVLLQVKYIFKKGYLNINYVSHSEDKKVIEDFQKAISKKGF